MLESIELNGQAISCGQVRENQATLRAAKREAARAEQKKGAKKAKTAKSQQEPTGQAPQASLGTDAAPPPEAAAPRKAPSAKRLQEESKARAGMDRLRVCWENMPDCRPTGQFDPDRFAKLSLV